jgi:rfaE bifunctional protein nucleotidyltransferase chain/domain
MVKVFTNGCFDLLHAGHKYILKECAKLGELHVGLNSDSSVKLLKGNSRPIWPQEKRKSELLNLTFVESVHIFNEETPYNLIASLNPDVLVKGGDYEKEEVVGADLVKEVVIIPLLEGVSTTKIVMDIYKADVHDKVWGKEEWIVNNELYCGKILCVDEGFRCSYHYHKFKDETFHLLDGKVRMKVEGEESIMLPGDTIRIKPGQRHTFTGLGSSRILEISTQHFESDSYREDVSGRVK